MQPARAAGAFRDVAETLHEKGLSDVRAPKRAGAWRFALLAIVVLAVTLRVAGVEWGLPNERHFTSYRADEWRAVQMGLQLDFAAGELVPTHRGDPYFNWGSLHIYLLAVAYTAAEAVSLIDSTGGIEDWSLATIARGHVLGRLVSALQGVAAVVLLFAMGSRWYGRRAGLLAALFLALSPLDGLEAHCALTNVSVAAWSLLGLAMIARAVELGRGRDHFLAGLAVGVALSSKLTALPLVPMALAAAAWGALAAERSGPRVRRVARALVQPAAGMLFGFAILSPAVLLHPLEFVRQAHEQLFVVPSQGAGPTFAARGSGYVDLFFLNLPVALGWALWALSMTGIAWAVLRLASGLRESGWRAPARATVGDAVALAWLFLQFVPVGMSETRFPRYLLPVTPILCLLASRVAVQAASVGGPRLALAARVAAGLAALYTGLYSAAQVQSMRREDPRDAAVVWFEENVPDGALIGLLHYPSHLMPPVHPFAAQPGERPSPAQAAVGHGPRDLRWVILDRDEELLRAVAPDYVVLAPIEMRRFIDAGYESAARLGKLLERDYEDAAGPWRSELRLLGIYFGVGHEVPGWAPAATEVRILKRRSASGSSGG